MCSLLAFEIPYRAMWKDTSRLVIRQWRNVWKVIKFAKPGYGQEKPINLAMRKDILCKTVVHLYNFELNILKYIMFSIFFSKTFSPNFHNTVDLSKGFFFKYTIYWIFTFLLRKTLLTLGCIGIVILLTTILVEKTHKTQLFSHNKQYDHMTNVWLSEIKGTLQEAVPPKYVGQLSNFEP